MRKIAIRIDDVTPNMDWEKFNQFTALLDKHEIKPLIGVIPNNKDKMLFAGECAMDYEEWLRAKKKAGWTIAMHGYDHCYITKNGGLFPLNHFSEFAGVPYKEQYAKIKNGSEILLDMGIRTDIFMAPGHSFDEHTVEALKENGFRYITDGFGNGPYERNNMVYLPIALKRSMEFKKKDGYSTFVVHPLTMTTEGIESYDEMLCNYREYFIDYSALLEVKPVKQKKADEMAEYALARLKGAMRR